MTPEELDDLQNKIDWEGGLIDYVCGYGGSMPEELSKEVNAVKLAVSELENRFEELLTENGVELI
jgi:hypothetical protein